MDDGLLIQRLAELESRVEELRRRRLLGWLAATAVAVVFSTLATGVWLRLAGDLQVERLTARSVHIRGSGKDAGIQLRVTDEGQPWCGLRDEDGRVRVCLGLPGGTPTLYLSDREGEERLCLSVLQRGDGPSIPCISLDDRRGATRMQLMLLEDASGAVSSGLYLQDQEGAARLQVAVLGDGLPMVRGCDEHGARLFGLP